MFDELIKSAKEVVETVERIKVGDKPKEKEVKE